MNDALPFEISEFEQLLRKPNGDPTGLAGFFNSGEVWVARVPARLDVMGGIADYSGANVCEAVLGRGMLMALQARTDRTLRIRSVQVGRRSLPVETRIPLDYLTSGDAVGAYAQMRELCLANPLAGWAAYIGGSIFTLLKEESVELPYGFSFMLLSAVPMNVGIGSSAAVEIGTLSCLNAYLGLQTRRRAHRAARPDGGKPRRRRALRHHGPDRRRQRTRRQAHAHPLPARLDCRRGGNPARHRLRRHQLDGAAFRRRQRLRQRPHRRVHGQKNHQRTPRQNRPRGAELSHRNFLRRTEGRIRSRKSPKRFSARIFSRNTRRTTIR